jgi:hypothetical protein
MPCDFRRAFLLRREIGGRSRRPSAVDGDAAPSAASSSIIRPRRSSTTPADDDRRSEPHLAPPPRPRHDARLDRPPRVATNACREGRGTSLGAPRILRGVFLCRRQSRRSPAGEAGSRVRARRLLQRAATENSDRGSHQRQWQRQRQSKRPEQRQKKSVVRCAVICSRKHP